MHVWIEYIKLARPLNLFIVFCTQLIIYHFVIHNNIDGYALNTLQQILLAISTTLVAAGGYVINDVFDLDIDKINKPNGNLAMGAINVQNAHRFYFVLTLTGFLTSLYIAILTLNLKLIFIYPLGVGLLYYYAKYIKRNGGLLANIVVSLMIFFVCILIIVAERKVLFTAMNYKYLLLITAFGVFAFFVNLAREIVKDMEDIYGDVIGNSKTLPITLGINHSKFICFFNTVIVIAISLLFIKMYPHDFRTIAYNINLIIVPLIVSMMKLYKAKEKFEFHQVSSILKAIMGFGLIYLILLSYV